MKPLCHVPNCADPSCRREHVAEPEPELRCPYCGHTPGCLCACPSKNWHRDEPTEDDIRQRVQDMNIVYWSNRSELFALPTNVAPSSSRQEPRRSDAD